VAWRVGEFGVGLVWFGFDGREEKGKGVGYKREGG